MEEVELLFEVIRWCDSRKTSQQQSEAQQPPVTSQQPPVTSQQPPITSQQPPVTSQQPPVTSQQPPVTSQQPPVTSQQPPVTSQQPPVTSQQPVVQQPNPTKRGWNTGLMNCCDDFGTCMSVFCLCELAAWQMSEDMGENSCLLLCMPCFIIPQLRTKFRTQQNIEGSICNDWLVATFCCPCALCQLIREHNATRP